MIKLIKTYIYIKYKNEETRTKIIFNIIYITNFYY